MNDRLAFEALCAELAALRQDLHAHPEIAFREERTSALVAERLAALGLEVDRGLAGTGVVGTLRRGEGGTIGLRADMDALPLDEQTGLGYASRHEGLMHACGHDGHAAMLLGAATWLARHGGFRGTCHFVFQPAEENLAGGKRMVEEGLFERFPMDAIFGLHNWPGIEAGFMGVRSGPVMASADFFELRICGTGGHAAYPHRARDPIVAAAQIVNAWQTLVSRSCDPLAAAVISVTRIRGGTTDNVIPDRVTLGGTVRSFDEAVRQGIEQGMRRMADGIAAAHEVVVTLDYERRYRSTVNDQAAAAVALSAMERVVGSERIVRDLPPTMGAEDFGWMLAACPGAYVMLGNGTQGAHGRALHNPGYDFNDAVIGVGVRYWVELVRKALPED
ncbi:M20 aminoacylase family protein [Thiorhodococcus minor]|uniref:Amidohydrolase n=1 Tax=Thiorhodococcus minor TaxID=57489 RepID=A0A6M0JXP9_9GAMM|nr:M20 aminoacylase family protein [Thiorhodococcus minor]NEV61413.1 amidohydrolase [Thiorhodococcus minor]